MYTALFGVFGLVGPMLEKRYGRKHNSVAQRSEDIAGDHSDALSLLPRADWGLQNHGSLDSKRRDES